MTFCIAPSARPTAQAIPKDVNRANSAAARAGTTSSGNVVEFSVMSGAASTPSMPAITEPMSVLMSDSVCGNRPTYIAETSFSAEARVRMPNPVQR